MHHLHNIVKQFLQNFLKSHLQAWMYRNISIEFIYILSGRDVNTAV